MTVVASDAAKRAARAPPAAQESLRRAGRECSIEGVIIGRVLYDGLFTPRDALARRSGAAAN